MHWKVWLNENWFLLLQSIGIIGSLWFAGAAFRLDARGRRIGNRLEINNQHRRIWEQLYDRPELARVKEMNPDLRAQPITVQEALFVNLLILNLGTAFRAIQDDVMSSPEQLGLDIKRFFSLPIPRAIWKKRRPFQDADFVQFVEAELNGQADSGS